MDGHHASTAGQYLGTCVFYEMLFGDSVEGNPFVPPGLDPAYARFLQEMAHQAVSDSQPQEANQPRGTALHATLRPGIETNAERRGP